MVSDGFDGRGRRDVLDPRLDAVRHRLPRVARGECNIWGNGKRDAILAKGRMADVTAAKVQDARGRLRIAGRSHQTLNHHRRAIRAFVLWARRDGRLRDDLLLGHAGFNVAEDRRHDRRTLSVEELRRLIETTETVPPDREMTGPLRALCYRLAVASGLR